MKCPLKPIKTIGVSKVAKENYDFSDLRQCIAYGEAKAPYNGITDFGECDVRQCMAYSSASAKCEMMNIRSKNYG